jgi:hypothetical protein
MKYYKKTSVNWAKSQTQIVKMLADFKIYNTRFTNLSDKFCLEFMAPLPGHEKPLGVRIVVPIQYTGDDEDKRQKELNRLHRVLFNHIKAKFVAIESGLTEFMEEFMPHLIIMDKNGNSSTLGQTLLPQYTESLESGEQKGFNLLGDGK